jgi:hypothetical protein
MLFFQSVEPLRTSSGLLHWRRMLRGPLALLAVGCSLWIPNRIAAGDASSGKRDVTFILTSDPHVGVENPKANPPITREKAAEGVRNDVDILLKTIGQPFPSNGPFAELNLGSVSKPRGWIIAGDLTDNLDWERFSSIFPPAGVGNDNEKIPVYVCLGNHDGDAKGASRKGIIERNRAHAEAKRFAALSENGLHYALNWDGVHILVLNLCPADTVDTETIFKYGKPGAGSWNDPDGAFTFMTSYLRDKVGTSGEPVILLHHYGFDGFSMNDWNWWTPKQRKALYEAIRPYNILAFIHGHNHAADHYRWPDEKMHAADIKAFFGEKPPADMKVYDVFSTGRTGWIFRIVDDKLVAAHRTEKGWTGNLNTVLPIKTVAVGTTK